MRSVKKYITAMACAALVLLLCAGCADKNAYVQAAGLFDEGRYQEALAVYDELAADEYEDSALRAAECRYQLAAQLYLSGDLEAAEQAMLALDGYADSAEVAAACREELDNIAAYDAACALMESDPAAARDAFAALDGYRDSALLMEVCLNRMGYAVSYMDEAFTVEPLVLGADDGGNVTLTVRLSGIVSVNFAGQITVPISPAAASVYVEGREYAYTECELDLEQNECTFRFGTAGPVELVELYANGSMADSIRYQIDPATLTAAEAE